MQTQPKAATENGNPTAPHVAYLDGLRALAALFIILHHELLQVTFEGVHLSRGMSRLTELLTYGHYAVDVFIVLSGFCLALPIVRGDGYLKGGAITFFKKRARRILPPYFCALLLSLLLIWLAIGHETGTHWDASLPVTWGSVLAHVLLLQDMFRSTDSRINHAFWSISVEWRIYFMFPVLIMIRRRLSSLFMAVAAVIISYAMLYLGQHSAINAVIDLDNGGVSPQYLGLFAIGILGADIAYGAAYSLSVLRRPLGIALLLAATTMLLILVSKARFAHGAIMPLTYKDLFVGLWAASVMCAASRTGSMAGWLGRALGWRPLVFVGTFAYSIYLIHGPLIQVIWQYVLYPLKANPVQMFWGLCVIGTPLIIGTAYLFFLVCERPFLSRRTPISLNKGNKDNE